MRDLRQKRGVLRIGLVVLKTHRRVRLFLIRLAWLAGAACPAAAEEGAPAGGVLTLGEAVAAALALSPELAAARALEDAARAGEGVARSGRYPVLNVVGDIRRDEAHAAAAVRAASRRFGDMTSFVPGGLARRAEVLNDLAVRMGELRAIREKLVADSDQVERREVRAPMDGVVKRVLIKTIGGVIEPGGALMEIVPADDRLLIEVRIAPADIGLLHEGQPAKVRLTAYDASIYGSLPGRVQRIGVDTLHTRDGVSFYPVTVGIEKDGLDPIQSALPLVPGMEAEVSIVTGTRTVLDYILKPVLKVKNRALRER